jgi:HEAT repeat protein
VAVCVAALCLAAPAFAQVPLTDAGGAQLTDLVGSPTMVTVVLKSGAEDPNLNVTGLGPNYVATKAADGTHNVYLFSDLKEIRVQGGRVEAAETKVNIGRALSASERTVVTRAVDRAAEIFQASKDDQATKMMAAALLVGNRSVAQTILTVGGEAANAGQITKDIDAAHEYLKQLAVSNDPPTALMAGISLYLANDPESAKPAVSPGLEGSSRQARSMAAELAGLVGDTSATNTLMTMVRDRAADVSAPAAVALARLGNREIIPTLLEMLGDINGDKGDAAVLGLATLGGEDVIEQLKAMLDHAQSVERFRIAIVLFRLRDPMGEQLLAREFLEVASLAREAAMALAAKGNARGLEYLRGKLDERMDETAENLKFRARSAGVLIEGGDRWAVSVLQEALRSENPEVEIYACNVISRSANRSLLTSVQPAIESADPGVAISACRAAFGITNQEFRTRWMTAWPNLLAQQRKGSISGGVTGG